MTTVHCSSQIRLIAAAMLLLSLPITSFAQETAPPMPDIWGLGNQKAPQVSNQTQELDNPVGEAKVKLTLRFDSLRAAGYPLPDVSDFEAYSGSTLIAAQQLTEGTADPCQAAVELALFLNSNIADTNLTDAIGSVDRPLWMVTKIAKTWALPNEAGLGGSALDFLAGWTKRFSLAGKVQDAYETVGILQEHFIETAAVQHGRWAQDAYTQAKKLGLDDEDMEEHIRDLQNDSLEELADINAENAAFEAEVAEAEALHVANLAEIDKIYADRMAWLAADEASGGERARRADWLQKRTDKNEPKPGMGAIIDPTRHPEEITHQWWFEETEIGGKYYLEERAQALLGKNGRLAAETLRHEKVITQLAYNFDRDMEGNLMELARLQVYRETVRDYALPIAKGECETIGKPKVTASDPAPVDPRSPEDKQLDGIISLPHDKLMAALDVLGVNGSEGFLNCLCHSAGYGSSGTSQTYHPDTIGTYDDRYSCQHPGDPCVVSGYGCTRHPLPSDPAIWKSCSISKADATTQPVTDAILSAMAKRAAVAAAKNRTKKEGATP